MQMNEVVKYYVKKFNITPIQLNEREQNVLEKLSNMFPTQDLLKAIDQLDRKPFNADALSRQLMTILSNLNAKPKKSEEKSEEKVEKKIEEAEQKRKPQRLTLNNIPDNYKEIFTKYNIPTNLIDHNLLSSLDKYLKTVYLSDLIAEYLYTNLPQEKSQQYTKIANQHFSKMTLSEKEKEEAYKIYIKMLIKKELGIYV
jgi:hypothetical protein